MTQNLLTLGIATYQEFDNGLWALLQTLREFHPSEVDILVIDNAPTPCQRTRGVTIASGGTYYHRPDLVGTSAPRDALFRLARTPWVLCVDAHIILCRDSVKYLLLHLEDHLHSRDLFQGPMVYDDGKGYSTHWKQDAPPGLWGTWDADTERVARHLPFEIPMMGLGLFAMRRDAWPGFNPLFHGFGGEEGYLHEKVRRQGGKCLCLPWLRWKHKFRHTEHGAPPPPYPTRLEDHVWNLLIGHRELGVGAIPQIREVFGLRLPDGVFEQMLKQVEQVQEWNTIRERKRLRLLGVWYTNNKAPLPLLQKSLGTIWNAQTQTMHHDVDVVTSAWNQVEGNPFVSMLGKPAEEGHAAIIRQVHRCLHDSGFNTNRGHDALLFLEHDVLYPACYFDRMGDLLATGAPVASNLDYLGLNQTGWLRVKERHEPLHQLALRRDVALANLKRAQRHCEKQGWALLEPDSHEGADRKEWARFQPNGLCPSVHVNHGNHFTSHHSVCYEATSPGLWDHPYWGPFEQWWPAEPVPRAQLATCNSRGAVMEGGQVATLEEIYLAMRRNPSDFNEHMDTLRKLAKDQVCVELSSWLKPALLSMAAGGPKELVSVCRGGKPEWGILKNFLGDRFHFIQQDPLSAEPIACDLLFIDTRHSAGELQALLERWAPLCTGRVVVHCTETYGDRGDDGGLGVNHALIGLVKADQGWKVAGHWRNNHGLTVLSRMEEVLHDPTIDSPNSLPVGKGPGTELKRLLSGLGINPTPSCDCNAYAAQMDLWGVPGCKEKREEIINWLRANQGRWGWKDRLMAAARAVASGLAFQLNPLDPFPGLVDAAIEAASKEGTG